MVLDHRTIFPREYPFIDPSPSVIMLFSHGLVSFGVQQGLFLFVEFTVCQWMLGILGARFLKLGFEQDTRGQLCKWFTEG